MKKKRILTALSAVLIMAGMSACSFTLTDSADVIKPPKAAGNQGEIQSCIDEMAGGSCTLKYPRSGEYRSAIIMKDLTGDGMEESIAFFTGADKSTGISVAIMDQSSGAWQTASSFSSTAAEIDRVVFCDINGDGNEELVVGWNSYGVMPSRLTAYVNTDGAYTEMSVEQKYSDLAIGNFTGNKFDSIMLFTPECADRNAAASLVTMNDQKDALKIASTVDMSSDVVEIDTITTGYLNKDTFGAVVEGTAADGLCVTQLIYSSGSALKNPLCDSAELKREAKLKSCDINHDGIIEIPTYKKMSYADDEDKSTVSDCIYWNVLDSGGNKLRAEKYTVLCEPGGYLFDIDAQWTEGLTARTDDDGTMQLYEWDTSTISPKKGEPVLTIKKYSQEQWDNETDKESCQEVASYDGSRYMVKLDPASENYKLTIDDVKKRFTLIEDVAGN